jgi:hypothetical protein
MADFEVLERFGDGRLRLRLTEGRLAGRVVIAFPDIPPLLSPYERADRLLRSLLTAEQIEDWETFEKFRVPSPFGILEFGQIFDIGFWPNAGSELRLCVLPTGDDDLPTPDIWANLLLAHKANPRWFFTVANWRKPEGRWNFGPVPGIEARI